MIKKFNELHSLSIREIKDLLHKYEIPRNDYSKIIDFHNDIRWLKMDKKELQVINQYFDFEERSREFFNIKNYKVFYLLKDENFYMDICKIPDDYYYINIGLANSYHVYKLDQLTELKKFFIILNK